MHMKVVCVKSCAGWDLVAGRVYTISGIGTWNGRLHVDVAEVERVDPGLGWRADRFRPIVERKTDISIFTAMLRPLKANA
jgi:hypothetical protein